MTSIGPRGDQSAADSLYTVPVVYLYLERLSGLQALTILARTPFERVPGSPLESLPWSDGHTSMKNR
jgi:hypothetical protein